MTRTNDKTAVRISETITSIYNYKLLTLHSDDFQFVCNQAILFS